MFIKWFPELNINEAKLNKKYKYSGSQHLKVKK